MHGVCRPAIVALIGVCCFAAQGASYRIANEDVDRSQIYWGDHKEFVNPAEVRHEEVVRATPEYEQIQNRRIVRDTARYWILLSQASERARKAIEAVGDEMDYDLVTREGYLQGLETPIAADDITAEVVAKIVESAQAPQEGAARTRNASTR